MVEVLLKAAEPEQVYFIYFSLNRGWRDYHWNLLLEALGWEIGVAVTMPCGTRVVLDREKLKLPLENILCPCGNRNHWIVRVGP